VGAELFHADGQTDGKMKTLIVTFSNIANAPKTYIKKKLLRATQKIVQDHRLEIIALLYIININHLTSVPFVDGQKINPVAKIIGVSE
jgi:hypothetical protein